jgi:capsular exopolysaccharide synthesis family protein
MEQQHYELTLAEYWRIIRKRKWTITFVFVMVIVSTIIFTKWQKPIYESSLELKIDKSQPMVALSGEQLASLDSGSRGSPFATELRLIKSLPVMRKVVEKMEVLPPDPQERESQVHLLSLDYQNRVDVEQIRDTNIVTISARSNDAQKAALMATAIADAYILENVEGRKKQSKALIEYINKQAEEYKNQLTDLEGQLQKFKQNEKVFEVTPAVKQTLDRLKVEGSFEFESEMLRIDNEIKALNESYPPEKSDAINKLLNDALADNFIFIGLKRRLLELEFERFLLLIDYTEKHPQVLAQDKIISEVKNKIVQMLKNYTQGSSDPEFETNLAIAIKRLFLETRKEVLYRIVNKFYEDSGSLSSNQVEYLGLKRNIDRILNSYDTLLKQRDEVNLNLAKVVDDVVTIVSPAQVPSGPIKPNMKVNIFVSIAVGLLLGLMVGFVTESMDSSVGTIHDVEHELNLSILGIIPHIGGEYLLSEKVEELDEKDKKMVFQRSRLVTITNPKSWPAESIKMLRSNLIQLMKSKHIKAILFTSSDKQEGKSTTVTNLAVSMAQLGKKTIFVGANMRRPTDYRIFGVERAPGLSDVLLGNATWKEVANTTTDILIGGYNVDDLLSMPGIENLTVLTCGRPVENVSELLNSAAFDKLIKELKTQFDVVIIDCSPVMAVPDAVTMCDRVDGVVLVYRVGQTSKDVLKMAKSNLLRSRANLLGIVLNDIKTEAQVGYSAFSYRYYGDKKDKKETLMDKWKRQLRREFKSEDNIFKN